MLIGAEGHGIGLLFEKMPTISSTHSKNLGDSFDISLRQVINAFV